MALAPNTPTIIKSAAARKVIKMPSNAAGRAIRKYLPVNESLKLFIF
jgi:hypothetical protein